MAVRRSGASLLAAELYGMMRLRASLVEGAEMVVTLQLSVGFLATQLAPLLPGE